jgi:hypothetical protein
MITTIRISYSLHGSSLAIIHRQYREHMENTIPMVRTIPVILMSIQLLAGTVNSTRYPLKNSADHRIGDPCVT